MGVVSSATITLIAAAATILLVEPTHAFAPSLPHTSSSNSRPSSSATTTAILRMVPLSNEEIFARAQQKKKEQEEAAAPPPMLYDDDMLADMQAALLLMEDRAKGGPGSLSVLQVDQLEAQLNKIRKEMKENEHLKPPKPQPSTVAAPAAQQTQPSAAAVQQPMAQSPPPAAPASSHAPPATTIGAAPQVIDMDTPADEGGEYDGRGGMGQAADTVNTYVIPGMDEMTAEEYQQALQQSVIDRQTRRKGTNVTGNRSSWNYMNSLTGETGVLKQDKDDDDEGDKGKGEGPKRTSRPSKT